MHLYMHYPIDEGVLQSLIHKEVRGLTPDLFAVLLREFNISFIALPVNVFSVFMLLSFQLKSLCQLY